ncbi:MAG: hypothetical protein HRU28_18865 [Rhizobiales bacterium]|nr:hypothetical protein [Hyphomicrobiales bacterium]
MKKNNKKKKLRNELAEAKNIHNVVKGFEKNANNVVKNLLQPSSHLTSGSDLLRNSISDSQVASTVVNKASSNASENVKIVISAVEKMDISISKISNDIDKTLKN